MRFTLFFSLLALAGACAVQPNVGTLEIALGQDHKKSREAEARVELQALHEKYDFERWIFTRNVVVEAGAIPHSHPVLTVNTRYIGDEVGTLSAFLHEQFHWYEEENKVAVDAAIADLRTIFPEVPTARPEAARSEYSTYLHLIVCLLEYDALTMIFGEAVAREEIEDKTYYTWVYRQVLESEEKIRSVMANHQLRLP